MKKGLKNCDFLLLLKNTASIRFYENKTSIFLVATLVQGLEKALTNVLDGELWPTSPA